MPTEDQAQVNLHAFVDEAWRFDRQVLKIPEMPAHSHWFKPVGNHEHSIHNPHSHGILHFDPAFHTKDVMYYSTTGYVDNSIKKELVKKLNDQLYKELGLPPALQYQPTIKENNMTDRQLRTPESTTVETKDLTVAIRALGAHDLDYLLDAVALVQDLKPGQRLLKAKKLKPQDVGVHLEVVDGPSGLLTDIRDYDEFSRQNNGFVKTVLGGKMVDVRGDDFVIVTALAN